MTPPIRYHTISQIGAFSALSNADADYLALDPTRCTGGGDAPLRTTVEQAPGRDGALIFPPLDDAQIVTLSGDLVVTSNGVGAGPGYFEALDVLLASLKTALDALKTAPGDLVHLGGTEKVWKHAPLEETWQSFWLCSVTFSLAVDVFA